MMNLESYTVQRELWPATGRVILAQYDASSVTVYQAYSPTTGHFAAENGYFGRGFSLQRMTWIKPSFLWMMYRSDWGRRSRQEVVLAIRLHREAFDEILSSAVHSHFDAEIYPDQEAWKTQQAASQVLLQWDPDRSPSGEGLSRRAIQLGLRGESTVNYSREWIIDIEDISALVAEQREHALLGDHEALMTPREEIYPVSGESAARIGV
jgi:hypothetical protein